jgi:hypothetical protein
MTRTLCLFALLLLGSSAARGQLGGFVESVGFEGSYQPDAWTPMVVTISTSSPENLACELRVTQRDMEGDRVSYTRGITLAGSPRGQTRQQKFLTYFIPTAASGGLPDSQEAGFSSEIARKLEVTLHSADGELISTLAMSAPLFNISPAGVFGLPARGVRLVVCVSEPGRSSVSAREYEQTLGIAESAVFVQIPPEKLPESELGYDGVHAVIWLNADPASLQLGGNERLDALRRFVEEGGHLVIVQPAEWQKTQGFGELLPVELRGMGELSDLSVLKSLAMVQNLPTEAARAWNALQPPFRIGLATPKAGSMVEKWARTAGGEAVPWLVRRPTGLGAVSWVAQDLGDGLLVRRAPSGWTAVWESILGQVGQPILNHPGLEDEIRLRWVSGGGVDLGGSMLPAMEMSGRSALLILLAVVFFVLYWLIAGPGSFAWLHGRGKVHLSWPAYAAIALAATVLTAGLVRLVLRGAPDARHVSLLRSAPGVPDSVRSRLGLYVPRDGTQEITLAGLAPGFAGMISPVPVHPAQLDPSRPEAVAPQEYRIALPEAGSGKPASAEVPYRSSLKKFLIRWNGDSGARIAGNPRIVPPGEGDITGKLTNGTGRALRNVYIAFRSMEDDWLLYMPDWGEGITIDLHREFNFRDAEGTERLLPIGLGGAPSPGNRQKSRGRLRLEWRDFWLNAFSPRMVGDQLTNDLSDMLPRSIPMLTFFDRIGPRQAPSTDRRVDMLRRSARDWSLSPALTAGALVVLAEFEPETPLPFPLMVEGRKVEGSGRTFLQVVIPVDRAMSPPAEETSKPEAE